MQRQQQSYIVDSRVTYEGLSDVHTLSLPIAEFNMTPWNVNVAVIVPSAVSKSHIQLLYDPLVVLSCNLMLFTIGGRRPIDLLQVSALSISYRKCLCTASAATIHVPK